nr:hypothetical protein [Kibdelosporangium sp. MJ126-NF4]CEL20847.1 hypothetical protein [Kibdelosporangium sp. MJ126-NF4]CTQ98348.1 hypothetical protein [Kibdelosporangium sp. MJ126-NF4]
MSKVSYGRMLDAAHEAVGPGAVVVGPGGYVYATTDRLDSAAGLDYTCRKWIAHPVTESMGVSCVRLVGHDATLASPLFRNRVVSAHVELLAGVVDHALGDLAGRFAEGSALLGRQLVQAGIADAAMLVDEVRDMTSALVLDHRVHARTFHRLVRGGRALLRLLGASGFLADGPGGALMTAELVGTLYLSVGERDE